MGLRLPKTSKGHDSVFVIVDRFTKMAHLIPHSKADKALHMTEIFFAEVMCSRELPLTIVYVRDKKFMSYCLGNSLEENA